MTTKTTTVHDLINQSINELPPLRRRIVNMRLRFNPEAREELEAMVMHKLAEPEYAGALALMGTSEQAVLQESFTSRTHFGIDTDKLIQILDLIKELLPIVLRIINLF